MASFLTDVFKARLEIRSVQDIKVENREQSVAIIQAMIDANFRLKIYFNWKENKDALLRKPEYFATLAKVKEKLQTFGLNFRDNETLAASIEAMHIPIEHVLNILNE